jgi:methionine-rich copper-binding protein CopC
LAALGNVAALGHAVLQSANPLVGSTVASAPREVSLTFSQNLEPAFSSVEVTDANGARVDRGKPQINGNTMRAGLKSLPPGTYRVHWHVLSVDTHKTEGSFTFRVGGT